MSLNVLITAGSRRVALVQAFQRALAATGGGQVFVTDINELSPAVYVASRAFRAPLSTDAAYLDVVADLCQSEHVGLVVPTIDDELAVFARGRRRLERLGLTVAVSPIETAEICDDKWETCRRLTAHGIPAAETFLPGTLPDDPVFPLFIKPRVGRGGVGAYAVRDQRELEFFLDYVPNPVVQQYLHGPEFTVDVFCNFDGEPLSIVPRERVVIRAGVMDRGRTVRDSRLTELALACTRALRFAGAINIQCRIVDGTPVVFEINPRFSGGVPLTIAAGADFPRMLVELARGATVRPSLGRFKEGLWMTSYEASMFLPAAAVGFSQPTTLARIPEVA